MSVNSYRLLQGAILLGGLIPGLAYLVLYRLSPRQWLNPAVRDASGWVVVLVALLAWGLYRLTIQAFAGPAPPPTRSQVVVLVILGLAIDGALVHRLRRYLRALAEERRHPTRVCRCCGGAGVVRIDGRVTHADDD